jgi:hypothetical protein
LEDRAVFRTLKQGLKVKTFVGISENVVQSQICTALIAMLALTYLQMRSTFDWSLSNMCGNNSRCTATCGRS